MSVFLYIRIYKNQPAELKRFVDKSAGLKLIADACGFTYATVGHLWDDDLKRAYARDNEDNHHWLLEFEEI